MNQLERDYRAEKTGVSQADKILAGLMVSPGEWVSMPLLWQISGAFAVHSRISDLRARGYNIEHKNEWADSVCKSYYRLVAMP